VAHPFFDHVKHFVAHYKPGIEKFAEGLFGDVIAGWSETACYQDNIRLASSFFECIKDIFSAVVNRCHSADIKAGFAKLRSHPGGIGIDGLTDQEFITDSDYFSFHIIRLKCKAIEILVFLQGIFLLFVLLCV
jgi:hypothetical protein